MRMRRESVPPATGGGHRERRRFGRWLERGLLGLALGCLGMFIAPLVEGRWFDLTAGRRLESLLAASGDAAASIQPDGLIGRLEIPRLGVSAIVAEGQEEATLRRAVGHIPGTALPGEGGNVGLAGHRDTFFRPLRHVRTGDHVRLTTIEGAFDYVVESVRVVDPDRLDVLARPARGEALTLVTCYPFEFVGRAPRRYVVRAQRQSS